MTWSDANGDHKMDPSEVTFTRQPSFWLQDTVFSTDFTAYTRNTAHRGVTSIWKIPMTGLNSEGAPVWDVTRIITAADRIPERGFRRGLLNHRHRANSHVRQSNLRYRSGGAYRVDIS